MHSVKYCMERIELIYDILPFSPNDYISLFCIIGHFFFFFDNSDYAILTLLFRQFMLKTSFKLHFVPSICSLFSEK